MQKVKKTTNELIKVISLVVVSGLAVVGFMDLFDAPESVQYVGSILFVGSLINNIYKK